MESSDIQYARSGGSSIAYQVFGDGRIDLAFVPFLFNLAFGWTHPKFARLIEHLASFARVIVVDKRGTGLSDRFREVPTLETRMDDLRAVLDEVGSERTALLGSFEGCHMTALFAATYLRGIDPGLADDPEFVDWYVTFFRLAASPASAAAFLPDDDGH